MGKCNIATSEKLKVVNCGRSEERKDVFRPADVIWGVNRIPISASVLDCSNAGLRLFIDSPHQLPKEVKVVLSHPRVEYSCEIIWKSEKEFGLKIIS